MNVGTAPPPHRAIRSEQLTLVLQGVAQSFPVGFVLSSLLAGVVYATTRHAVVGAWYATFLAGRVTAVLYARRSMRRNRTRAGDPRTERGLMLLKIYEGLCWGWLLAIGLPQGVPAVSILLMSLMGAICGNGVSLLSPLRYLYLALALPLLGIAFATLWGMGELSYRALALCCVLYVAGQFGQVRLANIRVREVIALRFENVALVDRLRAETDVARAARAEAERANSNKSRVLAAASHDLRQPVHALGLFLEALGRTPLDAGQRQVVESAKAASLASSDMLNTLLDFSRIEAGVIEPRVRNVAVQPLFDKLERDLAPLADAKGLFFRTKATGFRVASDEALLELILRNLILNAVQYTTTGGLLIACRRAGKFARIEIWDTGIGIAEPNQAEVFREFHQLGNPERDRRKGLGLGLAIVQGLAASLGHALALSSRTGRGSVFKVTVPLANADTASPNEMAATPSPGYDASFIGRRVLVIDDDPTVADAMAQLLGRWGCEVRTADSEDEALALARSRWRPELLICDYRLRVDRNGGEVVKTLRSNLGDIPAILITGDTAPARLREAALTGIPLMHKPVAPARLRDVLATMLPQEATNDRTPIHHLSLP